jgi:CDP-diacylglycerol--serine O-phosphatidyltransferase
VALHESAAVPVAVAVAGLSLLMVSTVRYRTFKDARLSPKSAGIFMLVVAGGLVIGTQLHPAYVVVAYSMTYLSVGLIESAFRARSRFAARKLGAGAVAGAAVLATDEDEADEDETDAEEDT